MYGTKTTRCIRNRQALPYGGMPSSALNRKMEETDPLLIDAIAQVDAFHDHEDYYTDYVRKQIIDRRLEEPWLESDLSCKDLAHSQSVLNLRYHGSRGQVANPVRHPELSLVQAMGVNADTQVPERPWSEQAIRIGRNKIHNQLKDNTHVFSTQKEGKINEVGPLSETNYAGHTIMQNPEKWQKKLSGRDYRGTELPVQKYGK
ncbi:6059_t:CDS:2, partial [Diversispora eburnea]